MVKVCLQCKGPRFDPWISKIQYPCLENSMDKVAWRTRMSQRVGYKWETLIFTFRTLKTDFIAYNAIHSLAGTILISTFFVTWSSLHVSVFSLLTATPGKMLNRLFFLQQVTCYLHFMVRHYKKKISTSRTELPISWNTRNIKGIKNPQFCDNCFSMHQVRNITDKVFWDKGLLRFSQNQSMGN